MKPAACSSGHKNLTWTGYDPSFVGHQVAWFHCNVCRTDGIIRWDRLTQGQRAAALEAYKLQLALAGAI